MRTLAIVALSVYYVPVAVWLSIFLKQLQEHSIRYNVTMFCFILAWPVSIPFAIYLIKKDTKNHD